MTFGEASLYAPMQIPSLGELNISLKAKILTMQLSIAMLARKVPALFKLVRCLDVSIFHLTYIVHGKYSPMPDQELEKVLDYVLALEALSEPAPAVVGPRKQALFELLQAQQAV